MATKKEQELELQLAQAKEELALSRESNTAGMGDTLLRELEALNKKGNRVPIDAIPYREIDDHRNVMLYTELNKEVGPLHPANARVTMERWFAEGVPLFVTKRTDAQVEAFKKTDRFKKYEEKRLAERKRIADKKPAVQIEKFAKLIARETGKTFQEELNLPQEG